MRNGFRPDGAAAMIGLLLVLGACGGLVGANAAKEARVTVQGTTEAQIQLVTSTVYELAQDSLGNIFPVLGTADTSLIALPYDHTYDIASAGRFLLLLSALDDKAATVTVRVYLDGNKKYDVTTNLQDSPVQYSYQHN